MSKRRKRKLPRIVLEKDSKQKNINEKLYSDLKKNLLKLNDFKV